MKKPASQTYAEYVSEMKTVAAGVPHRDFVPIKKPMIPADIQARIDEYRAIPSLMP